MTTNHQRITDGFQILTGVLAPYVGRELRTRFGDEWWNQGVLRVLHDHQKQDLPTDGEDSELIPTLDVARCLYLINLQWNDWFRSRLRHEHRAWINELATTRNKWAHKGIPDMSDEDAWRALDTMMRLTEPIDTQAVERLRELITTLRYRNVGPSTTTFGAETQRAATPRKANRVGDAEALRAELSRGPRTTPSVAPTPAPASTSGCSASILARAAAKTSPTPPAPTTRRAHGASGPGSRKKAPEPRFRVRPGFADRAVSTPDRVHGHMHDPVDEVLGGHPNHRQSAWVQPGGGRRAHARSRRRHRT